MARDRIRSRASLKGKDWTERQEFFALSEAKASWSRFTSTTLESAKLGPGLKSGPSVMGGVWHGSMLADDTVLSGSAVVSSVIVVSPVDSKLPSSDLVVCFRSKARAAVGGANPSKIKSP